MNSYNENLYNNVLGSLQNLQLAQQNMKSKLDASIFSLYYAEGARITASENLGLTDTKYYFQQKVRSQAVTNSNIAINLLTAANQQKRYTAQSVTNTAVSAANVQIAANAILRLASDVGSIYSILKAADYDSEIYIQAEEAYALINETAYEAERISQSAMEASTLTAGVSSSTVADEAKVANDSIASLFGVVSSGFNAISETVTANNAALAEASATEKVAEGVLEFINVEYFATKAAYQLNNRELNLNLCVPKNKRTNDSYVVSFDYYKSPFTIKQVSPRHKTDDKSVVEPLPKGGYPVKDYYIMLVKDSKKLVFTISNAESMLLNKTQYVKVSATHNNRNGVQKEIFISDLYDSDADRMELGQKYVVFVLAVLSEDYKKAINNFDDYLSAPSETFQLINQLSSPAHKDIVVNGHTVEFTLTETQKFDVEYRCMFLPDTSKLIKGLLSEKGLRTIEGEVEKLETIANKYDPIIEKLESEINTASSMLAGYNDKIAELTQELGNATTEDKKKIEEEIAATNKLVDDIRPSITSARVLLKNNLKDQEAAFRTIEPTKDTQPGFFFNLKLAEQITPANYIVATATVKEVKEGKLVHYQVTGKAKIDDNTTDNFGNPLIPGKKYVPIVLSASKALEENLAQFANSLSEYHVTDSFDYTPAEKSTAKK